MVNRERGGKWGGKREEVRAGRDGEGPSTLARLMGLVRPLPTKGGSPWQTYSLWIKSATSVARVMGGLASGLPWQPRSQLKDSITSGLT
jgi:hypothetical protein